MNRRTLRREDQVNILQQEEDDKEDDSEEDATSTRPVRMTEAQLEEHAAVRASDDGCGRLGFMRAFVDILTF